MNSAWSIPATLWPSLQGLWRALRTAAMPQHAARCASPAPAGNSLGAACAAAARSPARPSAHPPARPLRVVRVLESGQSRADTGRLVISGRLADVCAELDRLAACEAACR